MASGNYLALKVSNLFPSDAKVYTKMVEGNKPWVELDSDLNVVYRVASNDQVIKFKVVSAAHGEVEYTFNLDLTLTPAPEAEE